MVNNKITAFDWILAIFLGIFGITTLYPFLNMFFISISPMDEVVKSSGLMLFPKEIQFDAYEYVFKFGGLMAPLRNTLFITITGTALNIVMTCMGAYVIAEKEMPGRNFFMTMILITMFYGGGLIPGYLVNRALGLVDSIWVMIIPGAVGAWNLILLRYFFTSVPRSLKEAARIDGASELTILVRIMFPVSLPILATLTLFYAVGHWNVYMTAIIYISDQNLNPLQVAIRKMYEMSIMQVDDNTLPPPVETVRSATVILATLPILMVYPFVQKYFVKGIIVGSLKG
ncbi:carbohydrate ABC transporter permease [Ructibacterium gallinarum]|uniref:Carbohydrate ABC transporter permease n=1 Tax=Ructibacterium gallinarum TaxID=2779355 RepID=A0A9D5R9N6_9FIRM|nr:carbohydrate ABC transporter permease [Ructibacterium gallinarum]MBE5041260.1 carbohydrate ABC transporter permease [Ructibacterium gallinarum]